MSQPHESTGSYAVSALDTAELAEFEAHLATCPTCQDEVAELCETAAELSVLHAATPSPALRANILTAIGTAPRRPAPTGTVDRTPVPPVDELARRRRRTRVLSGLVAAVLALAVGLGAVVYTGIQQRQAQVAQTTLEEQLRRAPDAVTTTTALPGGGQVTFLASKQLNRALFVGTDLPDPGPSRYQLWTARGIDLQNLTGVARDVQVTDTDSPVRVFLTGDVAAADFVAVNLEPAGSTPAAPTTSVLAAGPTTA